ncbi:MAG: tetratricopeptide repeat protein [Planctomycetes bacterium]|nr:tetratricopeptide repeat protein [Planctomycetota bacterium]
MIVLAAVTATAWPASHVLLGEANDMILAPNGTPSPALDERSRAAILRAMRGVVTRTGLVSLAIDYPLNEAVFPPDMAAPTVIWSDPAPEANTWVIEVSCGDRGEPLYVLTQGATPPPARDSDPRTASEAGAAYKPPQPRVPPRRWMPSPPVWEQIKSMAQGRVLSITIVGLRGAELARRQDAGTTQGRDGYPSAKDRVWGPDALATVLSRGRVQISISPDPVGAPIFYRDVPLPFRHVLKNIDSIRWHLGEVSSYRPPVLLTGMKVCGNCHSFTPDGRTLAMDVDYGSDKGSYVIAPVRPRTILDKDTLISWSDYRREDKELTFGLLSQIAPDGRYVISTVKDRSVFAPVDDLFYSQRFFPVAGIMVVYDRQTKQFFPLRGADDRRYVQSNPVWSPDGKTILFARAESYALTGLKDPSSAVVERDEVTEFFEGGKKFRYDLYRVDFNEGRGGEAAPLAGASGNGMSNYFPRFSPDGRWIVYCQSDSFMLLRPDSTLYILPAAGGTPRKMRCNFPGRMNSWHSWSPNGRWLVFVSKANGPFTQLWLTHIDEQGNDSPAVVLEHFTAADRAANIPEFVNVRPEQFREIRQEFADYYTYYRIGAGYEQRHEYTKAIEEFHRALAEEPNHTESLYLLASCLARLDRPQEALGYARKAAVLAPNSPAVHGLLGGLLSGVGRYGEALAHLEAAYAVNPGDVTIVNNLAWLLATSPQATQRDGPRAVRLAEWACKTTSYKSPPLLDSLAAAYAQIGQFDQAIRTTEQAIAIVRTNPKASTATLESRLKLYQAGRPYREAPPE